MNDNLRTSQHGLEFIAKWEGCILKPYKDIAGLRTIGIGHLIKPDEIFADGVNITREKALELLSQDVGLCEEAIKRSIKVPLSQNQFDALISFGFNCGSGVYATSTACKLLNEGKYDQVPDALLMWSKAKVNGQMTTVQGLYNRRKSEGELFKTADEDQENSVELSEEEKKALQTQVAISTQKIVDNFMDSLDNQSKKVNS